MIRTRNLCLAAAVTAAMTLLTPPPAQSQVAKGAVIGAGIGALVGGSKGARNGAIAGAIVGGVKRSKRKR